MWTSRPAAVLSFSVTLRGVGEGVAAMTRLSGQGRVPLYQDNECLAGGSPGAGGPTFQRGCAWPTTEVSLNGRRRGRWRQPQAEPATGNRPIGRIGCRSFANAKAKVIQLLIIRALD